MENSEIFKGLKVVELATVLAGPLAGSFMAELGAEVIKIENVNTGGDMTRQWKNSKEEQNLPTSSYYYAANADKEVRFIDFNDESQLQEVYGLIGSADIVLSNLQKRVSEKYKLDPNYITKSNKNLIYVQLDAYSYDDERKGFDMVMQAETGYLSMCGVDGQLAKIPVAMMDILAGHHMKEGLLVALYQRAMGRGGAVVYVSLYDAAVTGLTYQATNYLNQQLIAKPMGTLHPNIAPYGETIITSDGAKLLLAVGSDGQFVQLCDAIQLKLHPKWRTNTGRLNDRRQLHIEVNALCEHINSVELSARLTQRGVPFGRVNNIEQALQSKDAAPMISWRKDGIASIKHLAFYIRESMGLL